jgi:hypothetical protein
MENPARNEGHATQQGKKKQSEDLPKSRQTITLIAFYLYWLKRLSFRLILYPTNWTTGQHQFARCRYQSPGIRGQGQEENHWIIMS